MPLFYTLDILKAVPVALNKKGLELHLAVIMTQRFMNYTKKNGETLLC